MKLRWKKLLVKTPLWLVAEIWLNFLGINNLADKFSFLVAAFTPKAVQKFTENKVK